MNHLKDLREAHGLRQLDLAMEAGCSRTAVMRMEQFVYPEPLPNVIAALSDITGDSINQLEILYRSDVDDHRYWSGQRWGLDDVTIALLDDYQVRSGDLEYGELFGYVRKALARRVGQSQSQIAFCMAFSIHPAVLSKYETGATNHLPSMVIDALRAGGLGRSELEYLSTSPSFNGVLVHHD